MVYLSFEIEKKSGKFCPDYWTEDLVQYYGYLVVNGKQELQETLKECNGLFTRHGLNINLEKTEVLHIGHQREELDIELEGKKLTQGDSFVYLGGAVYGDGETERERESYVEEQQRLQVCENNWVRKIARVTRADRRRMVELREWWS